MAPFNLIVTSKYIYQYLYHNIAYCKIQQTGLFWPIGTHGHFVAIERLRVLRYLDERPDGVIAGAGCSGLDQEPDEVVAGSRGGESDTDPGGRDVFGRYDPVRSGRDLGRLAVTRDHGAAREHGRTGFVAANDDHRTADDRQGGGERGCRVPAGSHRVPLVVIDMCLEYNNII